MTLLKPDKGLLLVAKPSIIGDVSFNRSVILLTEYNTENGSVGFIPIQKMVLWGLFLINH